MPVNDIYPYVVPMSYFDVPLVAGGLRSLDDFGIVRPVGHNVASVIVRVSDGLLKNVHRDGLAQLGMDVAEAERTALHNLSTLVTDGKSFKRQITKTPSGFHYIAWVGDWLTASCILWPGLYEWARKLLETEDVIVSIPQRQLMFVCSRGDKAFRGVMREYLQGVVKGMDKTISAEFFTLGPAGVSAFHEG